MNPLHRGIILFHLVSDGFDLLQTVLLAFSVKDVLSAKDIEVGNPF
jgi:hypothetical protein